MTLIICNNLDCRQNQDDKNKDSDAEGQILENNTDNLRLSLGH